MPADAAPAPVGDGDRVISVPKATWNTEDWWAVFLGGAILAAAAMLTWQSFPADLSERTQALKLAQAHLDRALISDEAASPANLKALRKAVEDKQAALAVNPLKPWLGKVGSWKDDPRKAFLDKKENGIGPALGTTFGILLVLFGIGSVALGRSALQFVPGFVVLFLLAILSFVLAGQEAIKHYGLEYALWALVVGLIISNTLGTPAFLKAAANTEFYIKTGLVLLGAEVLFNKLLDLGIPGMCMSWVVTPIVLITTYIFGQRVLRMESKSLNMVICADMSVCGVSAAIATAAACRAKKEELSLAIGLSLAFTVIMMVVQPAVIKATGMGEVIGGAWLGGTIDSTGAVAAAGGMLGPTALAVAATVKMIQNILIGAVAFGVAVYWVTCVEPSEQATKPRVSEIWQRFPRFILGFLAASLVFSWLSTLGPEGAAAVDTITKDTTGTLRGWLFCLAFVSIGLETNFRELSAYFAGGKPLVLYVCGQALNLLLSFAMAWLMFEKVFPHAADALAK